MKILFTGDFSTAHLNIAKGLRKLGHEAVVASDGDKYRKIPNDVNLYHKNGFLRWYTQEKFVNTHSNFDVVQFISPLIFMSRFGINQRLFRKLIRNNDKSFLMACGSDSFYWNTSRKEMRFNPLDAHLKDDLGGVLPYMATPECLDWNKELASTLNGVIPILYEYSLGYKPYKSLRSTIGLCVDVDTINYQENVVQNNQITFFHGVSRPGFKGTETIRKAFHLLQTRYNDRVKCVIADRMPYKEYTEVLQKSNVIVDQINCYGYGINALLGMAMGKIVVSGCESETLNDLAITDCPLVKSERDVEKLFESLSKVVESQNNIPEWGLKSRDYVVKNHNNVYIAEKYLKEWAK